MYFLDSKFLSLANSINPKLFEISAITFYDRVFRSSPPRGVLRKKVFWKYVPNLQERTHAGVWFSLLISFLGNCKYGSCESLKFSGEVLKLGKLKTFITLEVNHKRQPPG